jgi:hypothetical protein
MRRKGIRMGRSAVSIVVAIVARRGVRFISIAICRGTRGWHVHGRMRMNIATAVTMIMMIWIALMRVSRRVL